MYLPWSVVYPITPSPSPVALRPLSFQYNLTKLQSLCSFHCIHNSTVHSELLAKMSIKETSSEAEHRHLKVPNSVAIPKILRNVSLTAIAVVPGLVHRLCTIDLKKICTFTIYTLHFSVVLGVQKCGHIDAQDVVGYRQDDFHPPVSRTHHRRAIKHNCG